MLQQHVGDKRRREVRQEQPLDGAMPSQRGQGEGAQVQQGEA